MAIHYLKPPAIELHVRAAIRRHQLVRISISTRTGETFEAFAIPTSWHPIVQQRRKAATAARQSPITITDMEEIIGTSLNPIAYGYDTTIQGAVARLLKNLDAQTR